MSTAMFYLGQYTTCMALNFMICSKRGINPPTCLKWITCFNCGCKFLGGSNDSIVIVVEVVSSWMSSLWFWPTEQLNPVIWPVFFSLRDIFLHPIVHSELQALECYPSIKTKLSPYFHHAETLYLKTNRMVKMKSMPKLHLWTCSTFSWLSGRSRRFQKVSTYYETWIYEWRFIQIHSRLSRISRR